MRLDRADRGSGRLTAWRGGDFFGPVAPARLLCCRILVVPGRGGGVVGHPPAALALAGRERSDLGGCKNWRFRHKAQHRRAANSSTQTGPRAGPWAASQDALADTHARLERYCLSHLPANWGGSIAGRGAGVVFYALLALFPAVTALVSLYGLFADAAMIDDHLSGLNGLLPSGAIDIVHEQIAGLTAKSGTKLGFGFILGLGMAFWSANAGMKAIMDALNVVYDENEKRGFVKLNLVSIAFTLSAIVSLLVALGGVVVLPVLLNHLGLTLFRIARWPTLLALVVVGLAVIYRFGPSRREPRWQWLTVGSIFAAALWLGTSALLSSYMANYAHYDATYGSLGAGIGLMMWMWASSVCFW